MASTNHKLPHCYSVQNPEFSAGSENCSYCCLSAPGSRDLFELVLSEDLVPRLRGAKFESKLVTIPCKVLQEWCRAVESQSADLTVKVR